MSSRPTVTDLRLTSYAPESIYTDILTCLKLLVFAVKLWHISALERESCVLVVVSSGRLRSYPVHLFVCHMLILHRLPDRSRLWTGVKELFFGRGGPYQKLAALPAANVRVSDIQHAVQPYVSRRLAAPGNMGRIYVFVSL